jgi:GH24 family phage-related lysozyme (muramidase)
MKLLVAWEGFKNKMYLDQAKKESIGIGHLLTQHELESGQIFIENDYYNWKNGLTDELVYKLCDQDLARFQLAVNEGVEVAINQNQFDSLVLFAFNIGVDGFKGSTALKRLNSGAHARVGEAMKWWNKITNKKTGVVEVCQDLVDRREAEVKLFYSEKAI